MGRKCLCRARVISKHNEGVRKTFAVLGFFVLEEVDDFMQFFLQLTKDLLKKICEILKAFETINSSKLFFALAFPTPPFKSFTNFCKFYGNRISVAMTNM